MTKNAKQGIIQVIFNATSSGLGNCMNSGPNIKNTTIGIKPRMRNKSDNLKIRFLAFFITNDFNELLVKTLHIRDEIDYK